MRGFEITGIHLQPSMPQQAIGMVRVEFGGAGVGHAGGLRIAKTGDRTGMAVGGGSFLCPCIGPLRLVVGDGQEQLFRRSGIARLEQCECLSHPGIAPGGLFGSRRDGLADLFGRGLRTTWQDSGNRSPASVGDECLHKRGHVVELAVLLFEHAGLLKVAGALIGDTQAFFLPALRFFTFAPGSGNQPVVDTSERLHRPPNHPDSTQHCQHFAPPGRGDNRADQPVQK